MNRSEMIHVLNVELASAHSDVHELSTNQLERLLTPPAQNIQCWFEAVIYYFQTGDLVGTIARAIECLMANDKSTSDFLDCFVVFLRKVIAGDFTVDALLDLFNCLFSGGETDELPPPIERKVDRGCRG